MAAIHTDISELASTTGEWFSTAPTQTGVHPICAPQADALSAAVSAALVDWPAVHEASSSC